MPTLAFYFDYSCPYAYLASTQIEALAARSGAALEWRPMLLGGIFRAIGTAQRLFETLGPAKARHNELDMQRWAHRFGVPLNMPAGHPFRTVEALRATLAVGIDPRLVHALYRAYWVDGRDVGDRAVLGEVLRRTGHDDEAVLRRVDAADLRDELRARTDEALTRGIFGAPSFVVGDELFWGQDRLHFVESALSGDPGESPRVPPASTVGGRGLELYFDLSSPFAFLALTQAQSLAQATRASLTLRPMLLGAVFKAVGREDVPLFAFPESKRRYYLKDMMDWARYWGVTLSFPSRFPMRTVDVMRVVAVLPEPAQLAFARRAGHAYWAEDRDLSDERVLRDLLDGDPDGYLAIARSDVGKTALRDATARALDAGVFGAPTWVVDGTELFWGQDRIELVREALTRPRRSSEQTAT